MVIRRFCLLSPENYLFRVSLVLEPLMRFHFLTIYIANIVAADMVTFCSINRYHCSVSSFVLLVTNYLVLLCYQELWFAKHLCIVVTIMHLRTEIFQAMFNFPTLCYVPSYFYTNFPWRSQIHNVIVYV